MPRTSSGASRAITSDHAVRPMRHPLRPGRARPIDTALRVLSVSRHRASKVVFQTRSSRYLRPRRPLGSVISFGLKTCARFVKCAWIALVIAFIIESAPLRGDSTPTPLWWGVGCGPPPTRRLFQNTISEATAKKTTRKTPDISAKIRSADKTAASQLPSCLIPGILG